MIEKPVFGAGNRANDYGLGFYCTENADLAMEWAVRRDHDGWANGCLDLGFGVEAFWAHFLRSGVAERFGGGESRLLAGMSGIELAREVLECAGVSFQMPENPVCRDAKGPEYWAAWALAHYQWLRALPFAEIEASIPIRDVILMYAPYHEMDISGFVEEIGRRRMAAFTIRGVSVASVPSV